ncbi:prephenate dehydrogenase [Candidatus Methanoperedens nitroreducens]|uniref:Prephenate dehydrogenase n=1 Tax=Candidatus Methanoperedens nitratireducens TaxID=1392998 RepID=A0A062VDF8_9EURY|nr:prephenate dehydrogenase [Candidatus Methanoperedens nitroreducens]KCZ73280.1 prephenate dehydrogenase [Candidatus Methanoperedens nitroreducens]MDJ1422772.1 prephenate dehydrogenase [Candidatus Methanoperedens sp.]
MKILIIGGTGETGRWFAKFYKKHGFDVIIWGINQKKEIAQELGVKFADDLDREITTSDIVMISVPINITEKTIEEIAPKMPQESLLMDITSIKTGPIEAMKKYAPADVEILGTHPMFGPSIPDIRGQIVIFTPIEGRSSRWFPLIRGMYEDNGAHIEVMGAVQHDKMMAVVQGLTHFAYISIGSVFSELEFDVAQSRRFMSPMYDIMLDLVGRILAQNPYLYAMIQMNPEVAGVHKAYINRCNLMAEIVRDRDIEGFVDLMKKASSHFGDTESALRRSEKLIGTKIAEHEELVRSIGYERALKHIYSGVVHFGIIKKVTPRTVILERVGKTAELLIENVRLLDEKELLAWKATALRSVIRDISVFIPHGSDPQIIRDVVSRSDGVISADIIDVYNKQNAISITYRITIYGDCDAAGIQQNVETLLRGIGCTIR